jgi:hypothetical protein
VGLLPLFGYGRDPRRTLLATPLGFYYRNHQEGHTRAAFTLVYGDFRRARADFGIIPLLFYARRGTASTWVAPLFYHRSDPGLARSLTVIGPLFFGRNGAATHGGFLPLIFGRNDGRGSYRMTVVPLFHFDHREGRPGTDRLFTLLFGFVRSPTGYRAYLGPAYLRRDADVRSEALFPLFYHSRNLLTRTHTTLVFPLFFRTSSPERSLTAVTPLLWRYTTLTQRSVLLFPLVLDVHRLHESRLTAVGPLVPLIIRSRNHGERSTAWIFPPLLLYVKRHPEGINANLFPLLWHRESHERTTSVFLPLWYYLRRPDYRTAVFFPLVYHYWDKEKDSGFTVAFPFFWKRWVQDRYLSVFVPFGARWRTERAQHTLVLNAYYVAGIGRNKGAWDFHFWPLFSFGRPRPRDLEWNILGGLIGYLRAGRNRTFRLLWFIPIPMEPVGTTSAWYGATLRMSSRE